AGEGEDWQERALCAQVDPDSFFPEKGGSTREAKRICQGCEVRSECLEYALAHDERFGIWGGLSEREGRKLKPRPKAVPPAFYDQRGVVIQRMAEEGWTVTQIVDELDIGRDAVYKALGRHVDLGLAS